MRSLSVLALLTLLLAAAEPPREYFRYQPATGTRWSTRGTLSVKSWIGWPEGEQSSLEESELGWVDEVTERQPGRTILSRTISRWVRRDTGQNLATLQPIRVSVTEQLGLLEHDLLDQPDLYPRERVSIGDSWPIHKPVTLEPLPLGDRLLLLRSETSGTGHLTRADSDVAMLEADVTIRSAGRATDLESQSLTRSHWQIEVERAEGVPLEQKVRILTTQSLRLGRVTVPSRIEISLHLTTRRADH
jgi:hypothetical protein